MAIKMQEKRARIRSAADKETEANAQQLTRSNSDLTNVVFSERDQAVSDFPRAVVLYNLGLKKDLTQKKAISYFKEKTREARSVKASKQIGPAYERDIFKQVANQNVNDIAEIHEDQQIRTEAAAYAKQKFEQEVNDLSRQRRVPLNDSFTGKYELVTAKNRLKTALKASSSVPDRINLIGKEQLRTNVFRKSDDEVYDVITYEYDFLAQQLQAKDEADLGTIEERLIDKIKQHMRALEEF